MFIIVVGEVVMRVSSGLQDFSFFAAAKISTTKNYKDNPIIQKMVEGVKSDIDDNWNRYHGDREARLKDLADLVDMFDKLPKI